MLLGFVYGFLLASVIWNVYWNHRFKQAIK